MITDWQAQLEAMPTEPNWNRPGFRWRRDEMTGGCWLEVSEVHVIPLPAGEAVVDVRGTVCELATTGGGVPVEFEYCGERVSVRPDDDDLHEVLREECRFDGEPFADVVRGDRLVVIVSVGQEAPHAVAV